MAMRASSIESTSLEAPSARSETTIVLTDEAFRNFEDALAQPGEVDVQLREALLRPRKFTVVD